MFRCMATVMIEDLDEEIYEGLRARARANNRSVAAEARSVLEDRHRSTAAMVERLRRLQSGWPIPPGEPDSVATIRALRDER